MVPYKRNAARLTVEQKKNLTNIYLQSQHK